jgi:hypothetical protein
LWQGWKDDFDSFYTAAGAMEKRLRAALAAAEDDAEYQDFPLRPKAAARLRSVLKGLVESAGELRLGMKRIVMMEFGKGTVSILYDEETGEECLREGEADFVSDLDRGLLAGYPQAGLWDMGSSADEPDDS